MEKKILCMVADPDTRADSFSSSVTRAFLDELRADQPKCKITEVNLYDMDFPLLNVEFIESLEASRKDSEQLPFPVENEDGDRINELLDRLMEADAFIFISRTIGFGLPAQMKAFVEMLAISTQLRKTDALNGKKGVHIRIEDDLLAPGFPLGDQNIFENFLTHLSVNMMETLVLSHKHGSNDTSLQTGLFKLVEDTRYAAQEYARYISQ